jgi:hypothetical protein
MTIRDLCTTALLKLGIIGEGETPSAPQIAGALRVLNALLDTWATESLLVYVIDRQVFPLTAGVLSYTIGPGGVWNTTPLYTAGAPRPVHIDSLWWKDPATAIELPCGPVDAATYQGWRWDTVTTGPQALMAYYEPQFPLGVVYVWPTPAADSQMVLYLWHPWNRQQTLDDALSFPPGYQRALEFNLAVDLSTEYPGTLRADLVEIAVEAKDKIKVLNVRPGLMRSDAAGLLGAGQGNSLTGFYRWIAGT